MYGEEGQRAAVGEKGRNSTSPSPSASSSDHSDLSDDDAQDERQDATDARAPPVKKSVSTYKLYQSVLQILV